MYLFVSGEIYFGHTRWNHVSKYSNLENSPRHAVEILGRIRPYDFVEEVGIRQLIAEKIVYYGLPNYEDTTPWVEQDLPEIGYIHSGNGEYAAAWFPVKNDQDSFFIKNGFLFREQRNQIYLNTGINLMRMKLPEESLRNLARMEIKVSDPDSLTPLV